MSGLLSRKSPFFPAYLLLLCTRYLRARLSALAALLSVLFGVAVIVIVLSLMGGYIEQLTETIRAQESDLSIISRELYGITNVARLERRLAALPSVKATAPYDEAVAMYKSLTFEPCQLRGVLPSREAQVTALGKHILADTELKEVLSALYAARVGKEEAGDTDVTRHVPPHTAAARVLEEVVSREGRRPLDPTQIDGLFSAERTREVLAEQNPGVLDAVGDELPPAAVVGVHMLLDEKVFLGQVLSVVTVSPDTLAPRTERFVIVGAFRTGEYVVDSNTITVHLDALKNLLDLFDEKKGSYRYQGVRVALKDPSGAAAAQTAIEDALATEYPDLNVFRWDERSQTLREAVEIEKFLIYFLLVLLVSFTCCVVLLMLLLTVIEKTRDMGILLSLGATPGSIVRIFLVNGLLITVTGTLLGLGAGYLFCIYINPIHDTIQQLTGVELFAADIYHMNRIPILFQFWDVLLSVTPPLALGFLSSIIPALWASRRDPIKAIHYE